MPRRAGMGRLSVSRPRNPEMPFSNRFRRHGVELAGALAEISRRVLARDFRRIDPRGVRIILIGGTQRVFPAMTPESSVSARRQLERLGVEVMTSTMVTGIDERGVMHVWATRTVILGRWCSSVSARKVARRSARPH